LLSTSLSIAWMPFERSSSFTNCAIVRLPW
jgi:hypothetical protein